jgi:pSer/pThr/pTyr-binding forkhead associated (FHA) protein
MSKLVCTLDDRVINEYPLTKERISIGRKQNNDIVIDNLAVSGLHAVIVTIGKDSFLEDANSTNGTFVNLKPVRKHVLNHEDVIEIGRHHFKYIKEHTSTVTGSASNVSKEEHAGSTPLDKSPHTQPPSLKSLIQMSRPMRSEDEILSETTPVEIPAAALPIGKLHILNGSNTGKTLTLNKTLTTLGKPGAQVIVITKRTNGYFLSQVEGDEQPSINGNPVHTLSYGLKNKDLLEISGIKMEFTFA